MKGAAGTIDILILLGKWHGREEGILVGLLGFGEIFLQVTIETCRFSFAFVVVVVLRLAHKLFE
jgi:hypothetical protein